MSNEDRQLDPWEACPAGELSHMVQRLDATQRRARSKQVLRTALLSTAVFACVAFVAGSLMSPASNLYGGIPCSYCRDHFTDYQLHVAGERIQEDAAFVSSMKTHLEKCVFCRGKFNTRYPDQRIADLVATRPAVLIAMQPVFAIGQQAWY